MVMVPELQTISEKVASAERVSRPEVEWLWKNASDADLAALATTVRNRFHKPDECTYLIMAIINYTNVCVAKCDYCSFYRLPHQQGTYLLNFEQVAAKIDELLTF